MYEPPRKKSYYRPKEEELEMMQRAYRSGADVINFGTSVLGMSKRTAQRYASKILDPLFSFKHRGGTKNLKITPPIHDFIIDLVNENNEITLEEIRDTVLQRHPQFENLSIATIWKHLDCQLITSKVMRYVSNEANSPENLQRRVDYVNFISKLEPDIH